MARPIPVEQPVMSARFEVMAATVLRPIAAPPPTGHLEHDLGEAYRVRVTPVGAVEAAADVLGLRIVRRFDASMFGAALVEGRGDEPLVLKASPDLTLAQEWATGAAMAARLRERGYPASNYLETGTTGEVTWSLQAVLPGRVPRMFTVGHAEQLIALACRHDIDAGERRPWDELAREASWRALAELEPLPDRFDETLRSTLGETEDLSLAQIDHRARRLPPPELPRGRRPRDRRLRLGHREPG